MDRLLHVPFVHYKQIDPFHLCNIFCSFLHHIITTTYDKPPYALAMC